MTNNTNCGKSMMYYKNRLNFIKELFLDHQEELLLKNKDKIKKIMDGYNQFKDDPQYDPKLSKFPKFWLDIK